ncbi:hypothetical protein I4U23_023499 [Adineta vaga]|nr:hypothetical protein I4U23_023499 [Adineta vaga]
MYGFILGYFKIFLKSNIQIAECPVTSYNSRDDDDGMITSIKNQITCVVTRAAEYRKKYLKKCWLLSIVLQLLFQTIDDNNLQSTTIFKDLWFSITNEGVKSIEVQWEKQKNLCLEEVDLALHLSKQLALISKTSWTFMKFFVFILFISIAIPFHYGSTNPNYLIIRLLHSIFFLKHSFIPDVARPKLSADYRAFESLMRMKPLAQFDPSEDPFMVVKNIRTSFDMNSIIPKPSQCQINKETVQYNEHSVDTYWVNNHQNKFERNSDRIILYFHGGGYLLGDIKGYSGYECYLSQLFNITILHIEYRLCPEHPLPEAVEDTVAVYRALLRENISPSRLFVMGDSAGGGLSLLTIQALIHRHIPIPQGIVVLSPWTDLSASGDSFTSNRDKDVMFPTDDNDYMIKLILGPNHSQLLPNNSIYSPLFGSFQGFPPMYITVGTGEVYEDDSRRVVKKVQDANVDVTFEVGLHLLHVYPMFFLYYPEARRTLDNINRWIQAKFN